MIEHALLKHHYYQLVFLSTNPYGNTLPLLLLLLLLFALEISI